MKLQIEPQSVMNFFQEINQIPRESSNEKAVSDYIVKFAKDRNLEVSQDALWNVIIRKPATPGYENRTPVIIQGHMDMVCEKIASSTHDFTKDPIEHIIDGEWLHANGTTLGADNGIAVAMGLAILDSKNIEHGPLECLFTTQEETGMDGASAVKGSDLHGKYLINIDTEVEGEFIVSCAGGCRLDLEVPLLRDRIEPTMTHALSVTLQGLLGGHSGIEINKQRGNANQLLARILYDVSDSYDFQLTSFTGGTKHNAIPLKAVAHIVVKEADLNAIKTLFKSKLESIRKEYAVQDPNMELLVEDIAMPSQAYAPSTTEALLSFLYMAPHGVFGMSQSLPGLVETSNNLAIVKEEEHALYILVSIRSQSMSLLEYLRNKITYQAEKAGIKVSIRGSYPAWEYHRGSKLEEQAIATYTRLTGTEPIVTAVHAGLECGLLGAELPDVDMLSFGPTITGAHTPQERIHIPSIGNIYKFLVELLKDLQ